MIGQYQRISRRSRDDLLIGLNEYHVALCYLSWQQFDKAETHFRKAAFRWQLANLRVYQGLAEFALALTQHHALHYEEAMITFQSGSRLLRNLVEAALRGQILSPPVSLGLVQRLTSQLHEAEQELQADLRAMWTPAGLRRTAVDEVATQPTQAVPPAQTATATVARPQISPDLLRESAAPRAIPHHGGNGRWFRLIARTDSFLPEVHTGDWLLVDENPRRRPLLANDFLVVSAAIDGSIHVAPAERERHTAPHFLVQYLSGGRDGRLLLLPNGRHLPTPLDPGYLVGPVLGFWRETDGIG
jgi:tetratricopeptide (TPR) repeat protein